MNTLFRNFALWIVVAGFAAATAFAGPVKVGDKLPDLAALKLDGALPETAGHVVLIDFWASWCGPCKKSFPVMKELQEKFGARGFVVVGISLDEEKSAMDQFLKKNTVPFAIIHDAHGKSAEVFGVEKMPTSFIVGADGKVRSIHGGFESKTRQEYFNEIEAALKEAGK